MDNKVVIKEFLKIQNEINLVKNNIPKEVKGITFNLSEVEIKENNDDVYMTFSILINNIDTLTNNFLGFLDSIIKNENLLSKIKMEKNSIIILVRTK